MSRYGQLEPRPSFPVVPVAPLAAAPAEAAGVGETLEVTAEELELLLAQ